MYVCMYDNSYKLSFYIFWYIRTDDDSFMQSEYIAVLDFL
jgi:hypothetical protein